MLALASAYLPALTVSCNNLDAAAIRQLVKAKCPRLENLNLSYQRCSSTLNSEAAEYLVHRERPLLKTLNVTFTSIRIGNLLYSRWPALEELIMNTRFRGKDDIFPDKDDPVIVKQTSVPA